MQKIIGSIMVIATCTVFGFEKSRELQLHLRELENLKDIFVLLKKELQYTNAPFFELFLKIGGKMSGRHHEWLMELAKELKECQGGTFLVLWKKQIEKYFSKSGLSEIELEDLYRVGSSLGYPETIELYLEQLVVSIQSTREELKTKKKLYQSMGIMCGIFLVIVLL